MLCYIVGYPTGFLCKPMAIQKVCMLNTSSLASFNEYAEKLRDDYFLIKKCYASKLFTNSMKILMI